MIAAGGHLTSKEERKAEAFNAFFALVFNSNDRSQASWMPELEDHDWGSSDFPSIVTEIAREKLYQLNIDKSMGPDGIH